MFAVKSATLCAAAVLLAASPTSASTGEADRCRQSYVVRLGASLRRPPECYAPAMSRAVLVMLSRPCAALTFPRAHGQAKTKGAGSGASDASKCELFKRFSKVRRFEKSVLAPRHKNRKNTRSTGPVDRLRLRLPLGPTRAHTRRAGQELGAYATALGEHLPQLSTYAWGLLTAAPPAPRLPTPTRCSACPLRSATSTRAASARAVPHKLML